MKLFVLGFFISFPLYSNGNNFKPCQTVGFANIEEYAIPGIDTMTMDSANLSIQGRDEKIKLLKNCINKYSVCIVETPPKNSNWLSEKLIQPDNMNFDPVKRALLFGMIQYIDKKSDNRVCIVAMNNFVQAVPWYAVSWINDGKTIKQYELRGARLNTVMTPKSLYRSLLASQKNPAIKNRLIKTYNAPKPTKIN